MKQLLRQSVFETNSSSSHSFSVMKEKQDWNIPYELRFHIHDFESYPEDGDDMNSVYGRANYLYSAAVQFSMEDALKERIEEVCKKHGIKLIMKFQPVGSNTYYDEDGNEIIPDEVDEEAEWFDNRYHINHQGAWNAEELINLVMRDDIALLNYLFSDTTDIEITHDSCEQGVIGGDDRYIFGSVLNEEREEDEDE